MNYEEAKQEVAQKNGHADWKIAEYRRSREDIDMMHTQAAELYAKSKWDEACEVQKELIVQRYYNPDEYELETAIIDAPKPEFKP